MSSSYGAFRDQLSSKLDLVLTCIDGERFSGEEKDLVISQPPPYSSSSDLDRSKSPTRPTTRPSTSSGASALTNHFAKVWLYSNSRLPPYLPPFKVYLPTWPLLCLAAKSSEAAYSRPGGTEESSDYIPANIRTGTKAMVVKSLSNDDTNTIVLAIRGSQTFSDWAVNYRSAPVAPDGFLDDDGNLCHCGFLSVARSMILPITERLRQLLSNHPSRAHCFSLLITGHSAGGAVAQLLYAHMLSTRNNVSSELKDMTGFFRHVHCVTFGAPPVSLLPLRKPGVTVDRHGVEKESRESRKSLFFSFVNEGDPVARADKAVVASLLKLYASPPPGSSCATFNSKISALSSMTNLASTAAKPSKWSRRPKTEKPSSWPGASSSTSTASSVALPKWSTPPGALSLAGKIIVLRERRKPSAKTTKHRNVVLNGSEDVEALLVDDSMLREMVFGDPVVHMMKLYRTRIEELATRAVMGGH
ncbi:alpha/beta-hydrolase [Aulographum hederae CBS 113979]|uniref:Alpha/beta-hydrolase n=1 Tax=Aulographum hederae CBS 113979 TaxID=1176131 RepID=A0A6G1H4J4_9PEZI|nr:alpha/beta-hydrolase [Aulographum hederae CBS 113979]